MGFHAGELEVQEQAGVRATADDVGDGIVDFVSDGIADFLQRRRFVIVGTVDAARCVWASVVTGPPGFITVSSRRGLTLACSPVTGDPLFENLVVESHVALIAIDLLSSRRVRVNGTVVLKDGAIYLKTEKVYGNCRRYIQERIVADSRTEKAPKNELTSHRVCRRRNTS
jgi:predicted pyridoxine 5'-phosphate oxidase superfamily flavin-nucleotide-binding protein